MNNRPLPPLDGHLKSKRYPFLYSVRIVEDFIIKYSRATCFIAKKLDMDPRDLKLELTKLFMYKNRCWNVWRETIKYIDIHNMYGYLQVYDRSNFIKYLTCIRSLETDFLIDSEKLNKFS